MFTRDWIYFPYLSGTAIIIYQRVFAALASSVFYYYQMAFFAVNCM